jgi:undecaprenyl-diphosphatase
VLEYGPRYPAAYALELLPLYDAVARVKVRAHWQTDVLASFALGTAIGWYSHSHSRETPIAVKLLPGGISSGWSRSF